MTAGMPRLSSVPTLRTRPLVPSQIERERARISRRIERPETATASEDESLARPLGNPATQVHAECRSERLASVRQPSLQTPARDESQQLWPMARRRLLRHGAASVSRATR